MGFVFAWAGRAVLLAFGIWGISSGVASLPDVGRDVMAAFFGLVALGVLVATFRGTETAGIVLAAFGLWAALTWYGVSTIADPVAAIIESQASRKHRIGSTTEAYVQGGFFLFLANAPLVVWGWWRLTRREPDAPRLTRAQRREQAALREQAAERRERRQAAKRRRKRRR